MEQGAVTKDSMDVERLKVGAYRQLKLFEDDEISRCHAVNGEGGTGSVSVEESQASAAFKEGRALTENLMEKVCDRTNLNRAYKRVKARKGSPGVDGMNVYDMGDWIKTHKDELISSLLDGTYQPKPVKQVNIAKPGGGVRQLGIPTVIDRLVQQAILQVLTPIFDPTFSESSYGFRPGKSAHNAIRQASQYVSEGRNIVVDFDLEKFFDRVNHDILMSRLARRIDDKRVLKIVRRMLEAGIMANGIYSERYEGTPQGGPLSPLLANILLDDLDKELESRAHQFCRYADDCNIYVRTQRAGERVMNSITRFLTTRLQLRVNEGKSAVAHVATRKFLGYRIHNGGRLAIAPQSLKRAKEKIRAITRRNRSISFEERIRELNSFIRGWLEYFRLAQCRSHLKALDRWIRRKLRCVRLKQCKRPRAVARFLASCGVPLDWSICLAITGKGWWRMSKNAASSCSHDKEVVLQARTRQLDRQVSIVRIPRKPPWYRAGMPGGVRGGDRKESLYSISVKTTPIK